MNEDNIILSNKTRFHINDALYYNKFIINLFRFKDIHKNRYYIKIINKDDIKCPYIISIVSSKKTCQRTLNLFI